MAISIFVPIIHFVGVLPHEHAQCATWLKLHDNPLSFIKHQVTKLLYRYHAKANILDRAGVVLK